MILFHQENDRKLTLWLSISWAVLITPKCPRIIGVIPRIILSRAHLIEKRSQKNDQEAKTTILKKKKHTRSVLLIIQLSLFLMLCTVDCR